MWEILSFKVISGAENSNKFQKTKFWKEKSVEDMVTLGPTAQATLVVLNSQKLFHLHWSNWMPASKTKHGAPLTRLCSWMLIYKHIIWSLSIYFAQLCVRLNIFLFTHKSLPLSEDISDTCKRFGAQNVAHFVILNMVAIDTTNLPTNIWPTILEHHVMQDAILLVEFSNWL